MQRGARNPSGGPRRRCQGPNQTISVRNRTSAIECLLLGVKQTSISGDPMSAYSHKRKSRPLGHEPDGITHSDFARIALARASILSALSARAVCRSSAA